MSAFIVSPDTMHRCVKAFEHCEGKVACLPVSNPNELGRDLYAMNKAAVSWRYDGDLDGFEEVPDPYEYEDPGKLTVAGMYKSIACLTYQCAEGDVPNNALYKVAARVEERLIYELTLDPVASEKRSIRAMELSRNEPWD